MCTLIVKIQLHKMIPYFEVKNDTSLMIHSQLMSKINTKWADQVCLSVCLSVHSSACFIFDTIIGFSSNFVVRHCI